MTVGIMQPYFFPYLGYWQLIAAVDKYVVYDDVTYIKGGWINRNNILINGRASLITLPLNNSSSFKKINEICITESTKPIEKLIRSISMAYAKAPYKSEVMPIIESLLLHNTNIAKLNYESILKIREYLGFNTEIILSSDMVKDNELKGQDKVIYINKLLNSDRYINAIGGMELYDRDAFAAEGIDLKFLKMDIVSYKQLKNEFVPYLSIIDVLMFNGAAGTNELLTKFTLH